MCANARVANACCTAAAEAGHEKLAVCRPHAPAVDRQPCIDGSSVCLSRTTVKLDRAAGMLGDSESYMHGMDRREKILAAIRFSYVILYYTLHACDLKIKRKIRNAAFSFLRFL